MFGCTGVVGTKVAKEFPIDPKNKLGPRELHYGFVVRVYTAKGRLLYHIKYEDGDSEDVSEDELEVIRIDSSGGAGAAGASEDRPGEQPPPTSV